MGEVLARVVTVGSIVLTVASLALAVVFARKRSRIRVGFDLARAIIGVLVILVMAAITGVATSTIAVLLAVVGGLALGFGQGSKLEITGNDEGFHARRSPGAIALWGAGIVIMQAAGLASRAGVVRLGQTIAWFSACLGIGLMVGRTGPLKRTAARVATVIIALALPATVLFAGTGTQGTAVAAEGDRWVLAETRVNPNGAPTEFVSGVTPDYYVEPRFEGTFERFTITASSISAQWRYVDHGTENYNMTSTVTFDLPPAVLIPGEVVTLNASGSASGPYNGWNPFEQFEFRSDGFDFEGDSFFAFGLNPDNFPSSGSISPRFTVPTPYSDDAEFSISAFYWNCASCLVEWVYRAEMAPNDAPPPAVEENPPSGGDGSIPAPGIVEPKPVDETDGTTLGGGVPPGGEGGPIDPEEAAGQAIAGLIAAAAIGIITWGEATGEITRILTGLGGSGNGTPQKPSAPPPPPPPPMLDEDGNPMTISTSTTRDAAGDLVPPGMVEWVDGYGNASWIPRSEAVVRVEAERAARGANEKWLGRRAREAETTWMDDQSRQASVRRAGEEQAARERSAEREALDEWGRWIEQRDELDRRQGVLEADSARKSSTMDWLETLAEGFTEGVAEDVAALPGEVWDAAGNAIDWVGTELTDPENWRVAGETMWDSARDLGGLIVGDRATVTKVGGTMEAGAETAGRIAGALWEAAANDPAGAAVGVAKAVLGADNWEKVIDKSVPVSERLGRAIWGVFDTGGLVMGAGAGAIKALDTVGDAARAVDALGDAARAADALGDAARLGDAAADTARAADALGDAARAGDALGDATRLGDATADAARVGDAFGDTARGTGVLDDAARVSDDAADAARAGDAVSDTGKVPGYATDSVDDIRHLPEGAEITDPRLIEQTGYSQPQIAGMRNLAEKENVIIGARTTNIDSVRHIREGRAMPKPIEIKSKTINELDTFLGANPRDKGLVGYFEPKRPDLSKVPDSLHADVLSRYDARMSEYRKLSGDIDVLVQRGDLFPDKVRGILVDSRTGLPYAGDIDPVFFKDATTGKYLSADRYLEVVEKFKRSGAMGQHGAEVNVVGDLTMGKELGSPEWREAYEKALELQRKLEKGHISGSETVVQMGPDGILRRGPRFETGLPTVERSRPTGFDV